MKRLSIITLCLIILGVILSGCNPQTPLSRTSSANNDSMVDNMTTESVTDAPNESLTEMSKESADKTAEIAGPVSLEKIHVIDCSYTYSNSDGTFTDTYGNKHHVYHTFRGSADENYAIFNLNGEYTSFSGSFALSDSDESNSHYYATIFTDDNRRYESVEMTRTTGPVDFSVDVKGCKQLKIEVQGSYHGTGLRLFDAELEK